MNSLAGIEAKSQVLDRANKGWKHLAERNATAVFMHSFTADRSNRGITLPYIKLSLIRPETWKVLNGIEEFPVIHGSSRCSNPMLNLTTSLSF